MPLYCVMIEILTYNASLQERVKRLLFVIKPHYQRVDAATGHSKLLTAEAPGFSLSCSLQTTD